MTDTALAVTTPPALVEEFGSLPAPLLYGEKPVDVRLAYKESALRYRQALRSALDGIDKERDEAIALAFARHRELTTAKKEARAPLLALQERIDGLLIGYDDEDAAILAVESARYAAEEAAAQEAQDEAIARGDVEAALAVPPVSPPPQGPLRPQGLHYRETWHVEVTDMLSLLRHLVATPGLTHLVQLHEVNANKLAASLKGALRLPGTRVRVTKTPVTPRK